MRAAEPQEQRAFNLPSGVAEKTLKQFAEQSGRGVVFLSEKVKGIRTNAVHGTLAPRVALDQMIAGTPLTVSLDEKTGAFAIRRENEDPNAERAVQTGDRPKGQSKLEGETMQLPAFEVLAGRVLNMDVARTRDDAQPYVIYDRATLDNSGATNIEEFLKNHLTMNTQAGTNAQALTSLGNTSQINLRGLGTNQTLILIDGHRASSPALNGAPFQSDVNGIPLAAIERIEILPTTASGIYGGSATGGVVNIVLRRDYAGVELKVTYENTFDTDASIRRVDLSAGFSLEHGKTNVLLAGSWSQGSRLSVQDRDLFQRGRRTIFANNPAFFNAATTPPLGATTNIRSANGSPLFGPGSPNFTSVPVGYSGGGGLAPLQANAGRYNLDPSNSVQGGGGRSGLLNGPMVASINATIRRQFSSRLQVFLEASASNNEGEYPTSATSGTFSLPATAPNNPFGQAVTVAVPTPSSDVILETNILDRRVVGGAILKLPRDWMAEADYTWARARYSSFNPPFAFVAATSAAAVSSGAIDVLRDPGRSPFDFTAFIDQGTSRPVGPLYSTMRDATLRASGPLFTLPAGPLSISTLVERRTESLTETRIIAGTGASPIQLLTPSRSQSVNSAYFEARVPVVSAANARPGMKQLELQVALRGDDYEVEGTNGNIIVGSTTAITRLKNSNHSIDPTIGLRFRPFDDLLTRVSYGTGFVAPRVTDVVPNAPVTGSNFGIDPRRGNQALGPVARQVGGNPNLKPEQSESWSGGFVLTPRVLPDFRLSVDYTRITKTDNIASLATQVIIDNEDVLVGRVTRGPLPAGDPFSVGPITAIDATLVNIARAEVEAFDVQLDYSLKVGGFGTIDAFGIATWQTHFKTQIISRLPLLENVGVTANSPLKFKGNLGLLWKRGGWQGGWTMRYFDSYLVADPTLSSSPTTFLNQGTRRVKSQSYHDLFLGYRWPHHDAKGWSRLLDNTDIQVGVKNVFNEQPPFDAAATFFYSPFGSPRLASYYVSVRKAF